MYRIMMPKGRLVETREVMFVKEFKNHPMSASVDNANGIVFKSETGTMWWINGLSTQTVQSAWEHLLKKGYVGFSAHQFCTGLQSIPLSEGTYISMFGCMEDT